MYSYLNNLFVFLSVTPISDTLLKLFPMIAMQRSVGQRLNWVNFRSFNFIVQSYSTVSLITPPIFWFSFQNTAFGPTERSLLPTLTGGATCHGSPSLSNRIFCSDVHHSDILLSK